MNENIIVIFQILQLILMEGLLSIDQVAVIAERALALPDNPISDRKTNNRVLRWFFSRNQRVSAKNLGLLVAVVLRVVMLYGATKLIEYAFLRFAGAAYLIYLGVKHLAVGDQPGEDKEFGEQRTYGFIRTIFIIGFLDAIFAFDNVLTAVAVAEEFWVIVTGGLIGIATLFFGVEPAMKLITKEPRYKVIAYVLLLQIGCILLMDALEIAHISQFAKVLMTIGSVAFIHFYIRKLILGTLFGDVILTLGQICGNVYEIIHNMLKLVSNIVTLKPRIAWQNFKTLFWNIPELLVSILRLLISIIRLPGIFANTFGIFNPNIAIK